MQTRLSYVPMRDVKAPKETFVDGITGWDARTFSGPIAIANCNTMTITDFTYVPDGQNDAVIIAGVGDFPRNIVQQTKLFVVGASDE